jgi:hypothetical protein
VHLAKRRNASDTHRMPKSHHAKKVDDDKLAEALRANLRRRKAAARKAKSNGPEELKETGQGAKAPPDSQHDN